MRRFESGIYCLPSRLPNAHVVTLAAALVTKISAGVAADCTCRRPRGAAAYRRFLQQQQQRRRQHQYRALTEQPPVRPPRRHRKCQVGSHERACVRLASLAPPTRSQPSWTDRRSRKHVITPPLLFMCRQRYIYTRPARRHTASRECSFFLPARRLLAQY